MRNINFVFWISLAIGGLLWAAVLFWWSMYPPPIVIDKRVPGMDGAPPDTAAVSRASTDIGAIFERFDGVKPPAPNKVSWPRFRGAGGDNISTERIALRDFSDRKAPDVLWTVDMGEGHAAPAVHNGRVYVLDYDEAASADMLRCFSLDSGEEMWRRGYSVKIKRNHGMSRTVPAVSDDAVVTIGPLCHVMAAHPLTGALLWGIDMVAAYGAQVPLWYAGQCPLIDGNTAVLAPAGSTVLLTGINLKTGKALWETPNRHGWKMSHSSVVPMTFFGRKVYVYCASGGIVGVAADGKECGEILFETAEFNQAVVAPSPVQISGDRIFMTAGYGAGSAVFQVSQEDGKFSIAMTGRYGVRQGLASEQQTPLYAGKHLCAVLPKDAGAHRDQFACISEADLSAIKWASGPENLFGLGPFIAADGKFFILSDDGTLTVAEASSERFRRLGSAKICGGRDAWGPMALVSGRLLLRDSRKMYCVDLRR